MLACGDREACRQSQYNGTVAPRLCWLLRCLAATAAIVCAFCAAGCAVQLASLAAKEDSGAEHTGVVGGRAAEGWQPSDTDLSYVRAAAADVLAAGGKDTSVPWQNPQTGDGGNITPLATTYTEGGVPCRDFLASYAHGRSEDWLRGAGCRTSQGKWEVKSVKPLKPS